MFSLSVSLLFLFACLQITVLIWTIGNYHLELSDNVDDDGDDDDTSLGVFSSHLTSTKYVFQQIAIHPSISLFSISTTLCRVMGHVCLARGQTHPLPKIFFKVMILIHRFVLHKVAGL